MKTKIALALLLAQNAWAGAGQEGKGGQAVVCEKDGKKTVEMYDLFEAQETRLNTPNIDGSDYETIALKLIERIQVLDPAFAKQLTELYADFLSSKVFTDRSTVSELKDAGREYVTPAKDCYKTQIAVQKVGELLPDEKRYLIDKDLWNAMSSVHQASLLMHEILYRSVVLKSSDPAKLTSEHVRYYNSYFFGHETVDEVEYQKIAKGTAMGVSLFNTASSEEYRLPGVVFNVSKRVTSGEYLEPQPIFVDGQWVNVKKKSEKQDQRITHFEFENPVVVTGENYKFRCTGFVANGLNIPQSHIQQAFNLGSECVSDSLVFHLSEYDGIKYGLGKTYTGPSYTPWEAEHAVRVSINSALLRKDEMKIERLGDQGWTLNHLTGSRSFHELKKKPILLANGKTLKFDSSLTRKVKKFIKENKGDIFFIQHSDKLFESRGIDLLLTYNTRNGITSIRACSRTYNQKTGGWNFTCDFDLVPYAE